MYDTNEILKNAGITTIQSEYDFRFLNPEEIEAQLNALGNPEHLMKAYELYNTANGEFLSTYEEMAEVRLQIQSDTLEYINEVSEQNEKISEITSKEIEHSLNMLNEDELEDTINSFDLLEKKLINQKEQYASINNELWALNDQISQGDLSDPKYLEELTQLSDKAYEVAEALKEIRDEMYGKYGEVFDLGMEKIEDLNEHFDDLSGSLEHYQSILELLGKGKDFKQLDKIFRGQAQVAENAFDSAEAIYKMAQQQFDEADAKYQASIGTADEEFYKKQRDAAEQYVTETYDAWLSKGEEYAEKLRQVLENTLEEAAKTLEYALTNDLGFDQLSKELEHLQTQEEIFLTDTNKSYETTKLIRQAQMDIDKMTNKAHQNILKQFQTETKALQDKKQLSKDELELQQLKYNILVAQIALEDARDAKNKVRLMRDSQGNFNYVYTADQNQIDQAQQTLDDANNAYYNKALEVANNATQQQISLQQKAAEEMAAINADETLTQEQKEEKIADIRKKTMDLLEYYDDLYSIGSAALADKVGEAWTSNLRSNMATTEEFGIATAKYMRDSENAYEGFNNKVDKVEDLVGNNNREISKSIENITTKAEELEEKITNPTTGVVAEVEKSLNDMVLSMDKWYKDTGWYIDEEIKKFEALAKIANESLRISYGAISDDELQNTDYAADIEKYLSNPGTTTEDPYVKNKLAARQMKIDQLGLGDSVESNTDLINRLSAQKAEDIAARNPNAPNTMAYIQTSSTEEKESKDNNVGTGNFGYPLSSRAPVTSAFGYRGDIGVQGASQYHNGIDLGASRGTPILASDNGTVSKVNWNTQYNGNCIEIDHGNGFKTMYLHADSVNVEVNDIVSKGQTIGTVGNTGVGNGAHLDFRILKDGVAIDPTKYIKFDTGGYTGSWGAEGRLAMLHEKELVLNKRDTVNLLDTIKLVNEVLKATDSSRFQTSHTLNKTLSEMFKTGIANGIEQNVTITAEFPNATDKEEIKAAFDDIINEAVQYAGMGRD